MDFEKFSKNYDEIHNKNVRIFGEKSDYFSEYKVKLLSDFYTKNKISREINLLDLGCGIGKIERYFFSYFPKSKVYGIDTSQKSIRIASSAKTKASFSIYDGENIPFKYNFFDAVILSCVLHHIPLAKRKKIIKEVHRVLKKGGYLFVFEHNPFNPLTRWVARNCVFDADAKLLKKTSCVKSSKNSGFFIAETKYIVFFPKILRFLRKFESKLGWCPLGSQYFVAAKKL